MMTVLALLVGVVAGMCLVGLGQAAWAAHLADLERTRPLARPSSDLEDFERQEGC